MPITGLRLTDVVASGKVGLTARYTGDLELHHVQVNSDQGPAFAIEKASNLELDDIASRKAATGSPVLRLTSSPGAILRNSRAFPGTGTFVSAGAGELKALRLQGNVFSDAKTPTAER